MKRNVLFGTISLLAGSLLAADSSPKEDIQSAAKKLAEKSNYSWKTTVEMGGGAGGGGGRFRPGPTEGKTEKEGVTLLSMTFGENTSQAVLKGGKGAIKTEEGWKSLAEASEGDGGQFNPIMFRARMLQNFKAPAAEAADLVAKAKELKRSDDVYTGDMTEEGAKSLLTFRGFGGGGGPEISGAKGSLKFWIKDGALTKYQYNVKGTISFNGNDREVDRTTTIEIKDVGSTKVEVPEEVKKKLS